MRKFYRSVRHIVRIDLIKNEVDDLPCDTIRLYMAQGMIFERKISDFNF